MEALETRRFDLVALDLDGTLLDSEGNLPDRNRTVLHDAHERGIKVVLCTGRTITETLPVLSAIGLDLDAAVSTGGGLISDATNGHTLHSTYFERSLSDELVAWFRQHGYTVMSAHDPQEHGFDGYMFTGPRHHPALDRWRDMTPCEIRVTDSVPAETPIRLTIIDEPSTLRTLVSDFESKFATRVTHHLVEVPSYGFTVLETFSNAVTKWSAIQRLCTDWGIDQDATLAFGDGVNDVAMLRGAGLGIAVANADEHARGAADAHTVSNDDCGVAEVLEQLLARHG